MRLVPLILLPGVAAGCSTAPIAGIMDHIDKSHDRRTAIERSRPTASAERELPPDPYDEPPTPRTRRPSGPPKTFDPERKYEQELREADRESPPPEPRRPAPLETTSRPRRPAEPDIWDEEPIPPRRGPQTKPPPSDEREFR